MLGSSEMVAAAAADGYSGAYGVVTYDNLDVGTCVEITNTDSTNFPLAPTLTAQIFNTEASVVDVYMAGGGLGAYNGCSAAGSETSDPVSPFYSAYPTSSNTDFLSYLEGLGYSSASTQIDSVITSAGGVRGGATYAACVASAASGGSSRADAQASCAPGGNGCGGSDGLCIEDAATACALAFAGQSDYTTTKAVESCKFAFDYDLHWNRDVTVEVVACPAGLTALTGLVPSDPSDFTSQTFTTTTTTMEDCSLPTACRSSNTAGTGTSWMTEYDAMYSSNLAGSKYTGDDDPTTDPCD